MGAAEVMRLCGAWAQSWAFWGTGVGDVQVVRPGEGRTETQKGLDSYPCQCPAGRLVLHPGVASWEAMYLVPSRPPCRLGNEQKQFCCPKCPNMGSCPLGSKRA